MGSTAGIVPLSRWILSAASYFGAAARMKFTDDGLHQLMRKDSGNWLIWALSYKVWLKVREAGKLQAEDFTIRSTLMRSPILSVRGLG